ncbi:hypothetical protein HY469_05140 [Candidatus Roizmanbacteria bacterium]|nr:hypothetical protein [Candidatus Roizmanbacteria bacterium]
MGEKINHTQQYDIIADADNAVTDAENTYYMMLVHAAYLHDEGFDEVEINRVFQEVMGRGMRILDNIQVEQVRRKSTPR